MRNTLLLTLCLFGLVPFLEATGLSQNSGINPSDSYVVLDIAIQSQTSITFP